MKFANGFVKVIGTVFLGATLLASPKMSSAQQGYTASDSWEVPPGDYIHEGGIPGCGQVSFDPVAAAAQALAAYEVGGVYGSLASIAETAATQLSAHSGGDLARIINQAFGTGELANCVPVSVVIPTGAQVTGIEYWAADQTGNKPCYLGQDCQVGWSRFDPPVTYQAGKEMIISSNFRNWSGDRTRNVTMTVHFAY
jgi:hypothetical protein